MTACDSFSDLLDGRVRSGSDLSMEEVGKTITVYDLVWYTGICTEGYSNYEITITAGQPDKRFNPPVSTKTRLQLPLLQTFQLLNQSAKLNVRNRR
jgi:hypothetical protein